MSARCSSTSKSAMWLAKRTASTVSADLAWEKSDHDTARTHYEQALQLYRQVGDARGEANSIRSLGNLAYERSDDDTARTHYERALELYQQVGGVLGEANSISSLGDLARLQSDPGAARTYYEQALARYQLIPEPYSIGHTHWRLAKIADSASQRQEHVDAAQRAWDSIGRGAHSLSWSSATTINGWLHKTISKPIDKLARPDRNHRTRHR
jgi:tetratricopeptide (TPR) repeat protein